MDIKKTRRQRKALELICQKLDITDEELNKFIGESKPKAKEAIESKPKAKEAIELIEACMTLEELDKFDGDSRASVIKAYVSKKKELSENVE